MAFIKTNTRNGKKSVGTNGKFMYEKGFKKKFINQLSDFAVSVLSDSEKLLVIHFYETKRKKKRFTSFSSLFSSSLPFLLS